MRSQKETKPRGPMATSAGEVHEGHGGPDDGKASFKTRGKFMGVGSFAPNQTGARSVNVKTGSEPPTHK